MQITGIHPLCALLQPQIYQEDMMRSLLQNSLHVFRAISGTSTDLGWPLPGWHPSSCISSHFSLKDLNDDRGDSNSSWWLPSYACQNTPLPPVQHLDIIFKPQQQYFSECIAPTLTNCQHVRNGRSAVSRWVAMHFFSTFAINCRIACCFFTGRFCIKAIIFFHLLSATLTLQIYAGHGTPSQNVFFTTWLLEDDSISSSYHTVFCLAKHSCWASTVKNIPT